MKVILIKIKQAVKQLGNQLGNRRCSSANGLFTSEIVGAVTSLILVGPFCMTFNIFNSSNVYANYSISMTSSGAQSIDVVPGSSNNDTGIGTNIGVDNINIVSDCKAGYSFAISTSVNDNNLYLNGDISNNASGTYFSPANENTSLANTPNTWGYYFNPNNPTTTPTSNNTFLAVPTLASPSLIKSISDTASENGINDSFNIYYGVAVSNNLASGIYKMIPDTSVGNDGEGYSNGSIVYYLTMAESCQTPYMQDLDSNDLAELMPNEGDTYTLYDKRDGNDYQVAKINGNYWMAQNLRITNTTGQTVGTILADGSNFDSDFALDGDLASGNSYTSAYYHIPSASDLSASGLTAEQAGVWYNFCAAGAKTTGACNETTTYTGEGDICPAGWRLPNNTNNTAGGEIYDLMTTINSSTTLMNAFSPVYNGFYYSGNINNSGASGYLWSLTAYNEKRQYTPYYNNNRLNSGQNDKNYGFSVRCIKKADYASVTISFPDNISSVTFYNATYGVKTVDTSGTTITLKTDVSYTVTYSYNSAGNFKWSSISGTLSSDSNNPTTYTISAATDTLTIADRLYFQDATFADCGQTMYDNRGDDFYKNVAYTTATINGLCWMTRNLDLPGGTTLTSSDSNVSSNYTLPASSTSGFSSSSTTYVYNSGSTTCSSSSACYSYYSYAAATAGTGTSMLSGNAPSDICPKGWRLPTQAEFTTLRGTYYNGAKLVDSPFLGVYAGYYAGGQMYHGGSYGSYWSSTVYNSSKAYYLGFNSSTAYEDDNYKYYGYSIRCVKAPLSDGTYMQDVTADIVANTADGTTATLTDKRDEKTYTVAKINGALWMTQNLAVGCNGSGSTYGSSVSSKSLTSSDSNVSTTWSTPTALLSASANSSSTSGYTTAAMQCSSTYGAWYNYAAATAGTITGSSNSTAATYDICPAGWRLPTRSEFSGITSYSDAFSPVTGGYYYYGSLDGTGYGTWWSATANATTSRYRLFWNGSSLNTDGNSRYLGHYVRCVRS